MKNALTVEVEKPKDNTMYAAIAAANVTGIYSSEANGSFVVFKFESITPLEAFKLGRSYQHLSSI